jgi:hypothetical protein
MASVITQRKRTRNNVILNEPTHHNDKKSKTTIVNTGIQSDLINTLLQRRRELLSESTDIIDKKIMMIKESITECKNKRWLTRKMKDLTFDLQNLENEKNLILSGEKIKTFDNKMKPLMKRLQNAMKNKETVQISDAEREVRKRITRPTDAISLQRAAVADMCEDCGVSMRIIANDSLLGCIHCAKTKIIPVVSVPVADSEFVSTPYAQKSRLVEWLEFCQGKEYAEPSQDMLTVIMEQLFIQKATGLEDYVSTISKERQLNGPFTEVESSIKRLSSIPKLKEKLLSIKAGVVRSAMQNASFSQQDDKLRKFYERSPKYAAYISGYWPLRFTVYQEERIRSLYAVAVPAYEKYRKPSQPNWPGGYAYFLRCLCILLGWDEFLDHFNVTAGQKNIHEREGMRQKIWSKDLDWEYVPCTKPSTDCNSIISKRKRNVI